MNGKPDDMNRKLRVLFLPKWYPNRYDPMPGLFIQRQAEALTPFCDVAVIYVHADSECPNNIEVDFSEENQVRVIRVYYRVKAGTRSPAAKAIAFLKFYRAYMKAFHSIRAFLPDVVHAHILTRMGFVGWRIARSLKVPLVISEHWSRYFPENNNWHGFPEKLMTRFVLSRSSAVIAVSQILKDAMQKCGLTHRAFPVIPNVVDLALQPDEITQERTGLKTFLHISCFEDRSKNISGFLRAVKDLSEKRSDFQCLLVGTGPDWDNMREYAAFLQLPEDRVAFTGLKTGEAFASFMKEADFTVLSSNYETFGTVVVESLACGLPVVATLVGIAPEVIGKANGILVPAGDEHAMTAALNRMLDDCRLYDKVLIKNELADRFSRNTVGRKIMEVYLSLVGQPAGK